MEPPRDPEKTVEEQVAEWFQLGDRLFREGSEPLAVGYYQWITELDPDNARAWLMLGRCALVGLGGERAALEALRKAVELDPSNATAAAELKSLTRALASNPGNIDKGKRAFEELTQRFLQGIAAEGELEAGDNGQGANSSRNPRSETSQDSRDRTEPEQGLMIASMFFRSGQFAEARKRYELVLSAEPGNLDARIGAASSLIALGRLDEGLQALQDVVTDDPESAEAWHNIGSTYAQMGHLDQARSCLERAVEHGSERAETRYELAGVLYQLSRDNAERALEQLAFAIAAHPDFAPAHELRGRIFDDLERLKEALISYDRCLELAPDSPGAMFGRGLVLLRLEDVDGSIQQFRAMTESRFDNAGARANLAIARFEKGEEKAALEGLLTAMLRFPEEQALQQTWCQMRAKQMQAAGAAEPLDLHGIHLELGVALGRHRVAAQPDDPNAWGELAVAFIHARDEGAAEDAYRKAAEHGSTNGNDWFNLAVCEDRRGDVEAVLRATERALRYGWDDAPTWYLRAKSYQGLGNLLDARRCLENACARDPDEPTFPTMLKELDAAIASVLADQPKGVQYAVRCAACGSNAHVRVIPIGYTLDCEECAAAALEPDALAHLRSSLASVGLDALADG